MKVGYSPHTKNETLKFRLDDSQKDRVLELAKYNHMSISEVLREAVAIWINMNTPKDKDKNATVLPQNR